MPAVRSPTVGPMALYAGQGVGQITDVAPAAQVLTELTEQAAGRLREQER